MEDLAFPVPGIPIEETGLATQKNLILEKVRELCGWKRPAFPGAQPVSLSLTNIGELGRINYLACEKTDGVRYLLFAASKMVFLIDRKEAVRVLNLKLPLKGGYDYGRSDGNARSRTSLSSGVEDFEDPNLIPTHQSTLLDGELVLDKSPDGSTSIVNFLVYDAISINRNATISKLNLLERLKYALLHVVKPRQAYEAKFPMAIDVEKERKSYMSIYLKDFFEIWDLFAIRNYSSRRLPHLSDGIIFTPINLPYTGGTCKSLLKWKPPELNTVDFASEIIFTLDVNLKKVPVGSKLLIGHQGFRVDSGYWLAPQHGYFKTMIQNCHDPAELDSAIWECYYEPKAKVLIPAAVDADSARRALNEWQGFWRSQSQAINKKSRADNEGSLDQNQRLKRRLRLIESILEAHELEGGGRLERGPIKDHPALPPDVCPIAFDKNNSNYYDFTSCTVIDGGWVVERVRSDKTTPNDERVMQRVKESIEAAIDFCFLYDTLISYRRAGIKPVHTHCKLPEYFKEHGSRTQHEEPPGEILVEPEIVHAQLPTPIFNPFAELSNNYQMNAPPPRLPSLNPFEIAMGQPEAPVRESQQFGSLIPEAPQPPSSPETPALEPTVWSRDAAIGTLQPVTNIQVQHSSSDESSDRGHSSSSDEEY